MELIAKYLPEYSFRETHSREVLASPEIIMEAALAYRPDSDPLFRAAIALRELPMRMLSALGGKHETTTPPFSFSNFTLLESWPGRELAYGLVGRFWQFDYGLVPIEAEAFAPCFADMLRAIVQDDNAVIRKVMNVDFLMRKIVLPSLADSTDLLERVASDAHAIVGSFLALAAPIVAERHGIPYIFGPLQPMPWFSPLDPPSSPDLKLCAKPPLGPLKSDGIIFFSA